jgi:putative hemolysin
MKKMTMNKIALQTLSLLTLMASVSFAGGSTTVGPSNPASVNCINLGGKLEIQTSTAGEYANCAIEEWQLFNEMSKRGLIKENEINPGVPSGIANPASKNCKNVEGQFRRESSPAGEFSLCIVEEWTLIKYINVVTQP